MTVVETADAGEAAAVAAERIASALERALAEASRATIAISGGRTPWQALALLPAGADWASVDVYQVDERVAPFGDPARNLTQLEAVLLSRLPVVAHPMPVEAADLDRAAAAYAAALPGALDLVQLGLGADGHTASLVPGDPALQAAGDVALTAPYQGHRRMTLTFPAINRAKQVLWIVTGAEKREALAALLAGTAPIPANRVVRDRAVIIADRAALGR